jgi:aarF domain-containing kinase
MIDEWCKEAPKELDFNHEAGSSPWSNSYARAPLHLLPNSLFISHGLVNYKEVQKLILAENTRTVSKNLSQKIEGETGSVSSEVDVLIPEVIQV